MNATITRQQEIQFDLMRLASFNAYNGERVVADLLAHRDLWTAALMDSLGDLIKLRDLPNGHWNVDTLYITSSGADDDALDSLVGEWNADEIWWTEGEEASILLGQFGPDTPRILTVWWD